MQNIQPTLAQLPGKDCGLCGSKTCTDFAALVADQSVKLDRCIHLAQAGAGNSQMNMTNPATTWVDHLGREYDFILDKFAGELGPRETILLFNPANVEKLGIKKGDVLYGRPGWISCGCPVTHAGIVVEEPDYFNGTLVWCITGPMMARERGINIGYYNSTAYEGLVKESRTELKIGMRYHFLPRFCMLQWRHCGLVNTIGKTPEGTRVRIEGLWIG
jgi:uncharacterized protein